MGYWSWVFNESKHWAKQVDVARGRLQVDYLHQPRGLRTLQRHTYVTSSRDLVMYPLKRLMYTWIACMDKGALFCILSYLT
jgi:hypothetical protein